MNINKIALLILPLLLSFSITAKEIGLEISYTEFMDKENQAYLELYFALDGNSLDYELQDEGFVGGVEVTVTLLKDSNIVAADKLRLLSPHLTDTSNVSEVFINQLRLPVEPGIYTMKIDLQDINEPEETYHIEQSVESVLGKDELASSELLFLDSYEKSESPGMFTKSGYDLIPLVTSGSHYFNETTTTISFYTELYNTAKALGEDEPYVVKYYLKDANVNRVLDDYASFSKKSASQVEPVLARFSIADLRTGNYELVLEALNKEGEVILSDSKFFYRKNAMEPVLSAEDISDRELAESFVQDVREQDSIFLFMKYLNPISTDAERGHQKALLKERDMKKMKRYFYAFWNKYDQANPGKAWKDYYRNVRMANERYGNRIRPGYMSDRGRVLLVYGKPDMVDVRKMEPNMPNYEIWQYNQINTPYAMQQTNRMFVFAEFDASTNQYELFHSTAVGELQSRRWRYEMRLKYGGASGDIDDQRASFPTSPMGTRLEDNIIINSTGSDRQNR